MRTLVARRPSPAMVVACIALLVALGGTSIAAVNALPRRSVGTPQLKNNAVTSIKVRNRSLRAVDFARGQLPAGPQGPEGPQGRNGRDGRHGRQGRPRFVPRLGARQRPTGRSSPTPTSPRVQRLQVGVYCVFLIEDVANLDSRRRRRQPTSAWHASYAGPRSSGCGGASPASR